MFCPPGVATEKTKHRRVVEELRDGECKNMWQVSECEEVPVMGKVVGISSL